MLSLRLPSLSSVISCAASLNISHRLTLCSAAVFLAWRPSSLYPTLALSWILFSPCLSRLDSTGISLAESASEMSMRDSTSRATARSASRRSKDDDVAEPTLLRGLGFDAPFPPVAPFLPAKPKEEDRLTTSMDCLLLFGLLSLAFARACASASIICSRALFDSASIWLWLWLSTSANERVTSSSSLDSTDVRCGACAGFFSGTGKRSSSLACPADAGMEGRRSDAVITFGLAASTSRERLDDSAPVSVCDGVESGESVGDPADIVSSAFTTGSPSKPSSPKNVCRDSSRRMPRPCIADKVWPCSSYCSSSASSAPPSDRRREPRSRLPLFALIFAVRT